jgi:hypothetical protein
MSIENLKTFGKFATCPLLAHVGQHPHLHIFPRICTLLTRLGDASAPGLSVKMWISTLPHLVSPHLTAAG